MSLYPALMLVCVALSLIIILTVTLKSKHFFKSFLLSALSGLGGLFAVYTLSLFTSLSLRVNLFTLLLSALGGIPAVIALTVTAFVT